MLLERIALALIIAQELRTQIEANGGFYDGRMAPNLTSITDVLSISDALLKSQIPKLPPKVTTAMYNMLEPLQAYHRGP